MVQSANLLACPFVSVGPNESLKDIFPEGSDASAWKKAIEHNTLKSNVDDISDSIVQVGVFSSDMTILRLVPDCPLPSVPALTARAVVARPSRLQSRHCRSLPGCRPLCSRPPH